MHCYCIKRILMVAYTQVKRMYIIEKGHIGIVEKAKETSSDIGNVCMCHYCAMDGKVWIYMYIIRIEKGHIGIVEKAQETSSDIGNVCMCHYCAMENPIQMQFHVHRYYGY